MAGSLPYFGLIGSVLAFAASTIFPPDSAAPFLLPLFALVFAVYLIIAGIRAAIRKDRMMIALFVTAGVTLALSILSALGYAGNISTKSSSFSLGVPDEYAVVFALIAGLQAPIVILALRWYELNRIMAYIGVAGAAIALLLTLTSPDSIVDQTAWQTWLVGLACLATLAPSISLMRGVPA